MLKFSKSLIVVLVICLMSSLCLDLNYCVRASEGNENSIIVEVSENTTATNNPDLKSEPRNVQKSITDGMTIRTNPKPVDSDYPEGLLREWAYLKFNITDINKVIVSAKLHITYLQKDMTPRVAVYGADNNWTESSLTWENRPAHNENVLVEKVMETHDDYELDSVGFDVTSYIQQQQLKDKVATLALEKVSQGGSMFRIKPKEADGGTYKAYLEIKTGDMKLPVPEQMLVGVSENTTVSNNPDSISTPQTVSKKISDGLTSRKNPQVDNDKYPDGFYHEWIYLKFDLGSVSSRIINAKLHVAYTQPNQDPNVAVYKADNDWSESTLTWENQPYYDDLALVEKKMLRNNDYEWDNEGFDITSYIQQQQLGDKTSTLVIRKLTESGAIFRIKPKEADGGVYKAYLKLELEPSPTFMIGQCEYKDVEGNIVSNFSENSKVITSVTALNTYNDLSKDITLIVALYDDNELLRDIKYLHETLQPTSSKEYLVEFDIPENITASSYIKSFVWDGLENMQPLSNEYRLPKQQ